MSNIHDYLIWRGDLELKDFPLNEVDKLILAKISCLPFSLIELNDTETIETLTSKLKDFGTEQFSMSGDKKLVELLNQSKRFKNLKLSDFKFKTDFEEEKQFAAVTIHIDIKTLYVSFAGTDNTFVGWKEDFNLSFMKNIPAQVEGYSYLNKIIKTYWKKVYVGGHSKGGNIAIYSSIMIDKRYQKRIIEINNYDGPGFDKDSVDEKNYKYIINKINTFLPQSSIIGRIFERQEEYKVIQSSETGIYQHDIYSWDILKTEIVKVNKFTEESEIINNILTKLLKVTSSEERKKVVDIIYALIESTDTVSIREFSKEKVKNMRKIIKSYQNISNEDKKIITKVIIELGKIAKDSWKK